MQLFSIHKESKTDTTFIFKAILNPSHNIFEGHFPDTPVVPGVCTMDMVKRCCCEVLNEEVRFDYIKEVKFLATILPTEHRELEVVIEFKAQMDIAVVVKCEERIMLKLRATLI